MKKLIAIMICAVMAAASAVAVSAQEEENAAEKFYQELENIISEAITQETGTEEEAALPALSEPVFLYTTGDAVFSLDGQDIDPENGIILQMMDDDAVNQDDETQDSDIILKEMPGFLSEAFKFPAVYELTADTKVDPDKTYYVQDEDDPESYSEVDDPEEEALSGYYEKITGNCKVQLNITDGEYEGDIYNATGYYSQAPDFLEVNISAGAVLTGDIALTSGVHGMFIGAMNIDEIISVLENRKAEHDNQEGVSAENDTDADPGYALIDRDANVTDDKEKAVAVQFTRVYDGETFILGKVVNSLNYNKASAADVNVEGTWTVKSASLITGLDVKEDALVYGEIIELADGSLMIIPSEEPLEPGQYGTAGK